MVTVKDTEHFVTLFDNNFLPMGIALHFSLMQHAKPFHLWVVCMDDLVEKNLISLSLPHVSLVSLRDLETDELRKVKPSRSKGEYCWTMTPFTPQAVFERDTTAQRVTYVDADLFFFDDPRVLLQELTFSKKHVLITEHGYAPEYAHQSTANGRFCVQFVTFYRCEAARKVLTWWQERCVAWCYDRLEDGKFGDQMYLDLWPELFASDVHIVLQKDKTLAPWNVMHFEKTNGTNLAPVFYHFHGLRIISKNKIKLYQGYKIGESGFAIYNVYVNYLKKVFLQLACNDISIPTMVLPKSVLSILRDIKKRIKKNVAYCNY
jgi:hypothetical protein